MSRAPYDWLGSHQLHTLPTGTTISVETHGRRAARTVGRITHTTDTTLQLTTTRGEAEMTLTRIKRARIVGSLYEPGDPVLRRHIPATDWRGGVVRTQGTDVLVEQIGGEFAWFPEDELEPADARDPLPAPSRRGPVPARALG